MDNPQVCECCNEYTDDSKPVCETCITASMVADPRIAELETALRNQKEVKKRYVISHADDHLAVKDLQSRIDAAVEKAIFHHSHAVGTQKDPFADIVEILAGEATP